jgi:hypothetical protein
MIRVSGWKSCVIAKDGQLSGVCDLGKPYEYAVIQVPTIDTATLVVRASRTVTGTGIGLYITHDQTAVPVALNVASGTGNFMWMIPLMGVQYLWFYTGAAQSTAAVTFYVRGFNGAVKTN